MGKKEEIIEQEKNLNNFKREGGWGGENIME